MKDEKMDGYKGEVEREKEKGGGKEGRRNTFTLTDTATESKRKQNPPHYTHTPPQLKEILAP